MVKFASDNGKILATYDRSDRILRSLENYSNIALPKAVRNATYKEHPNRDLYSTSYTVNYDGKNAKKVYQVQIKKDNGKKTLKFDIYGNRKN